MMNDNNQSEKIIKNLQEDWNQLEKLSTSEEPSALFLKDNLQHYQSRKKKGCRRKGFSLLFVKRGASLR